MLTSSKHLILLCNHVYIPRLYFLYFSYPCATVFPNTLISLSFLSPVWQAIFLSLSLVYIITKGGPFLILPHTSLLIGTHSYHHVFIKFLLSNLMHFHRRTWLRHYFSPASQFPCLDWSALISTGNCFFSHLNEAVFWSHFVRLWLYFFSSCLHIKISWKGFLYMLPSISPPYPLLNLYQS